MNWYVCHSKSSTLFMPHYDPLVCKRDAAQDCNAICPPAPGRVMIFGKSLQVALTEFVCNTSPKSVVDYWTGEVLYKETM